MGWLKKKVSSKVEQIKQDLKENKAADEIMRKKARAAYFRAQEEQRIRLARVRALQEAMAKERRIKAKYAKKPPIKFNFDSVFGQSISTPKSNIPKTNLIQKSSLMNPSYFKLSKPVVPKIIPKKKKSKG